MNDVIVGAAMGLAYNASAVFEGMLGGRLRYISMAVLGCLALVYYAGRIVRQKQAAYHLLHVLLAALAMAVTVNVLPFHTFADVEKAAEAEREKRRAELGKPVAGFVLPSSIKRYLTEADLEDMPLQVVNYAKNEMYARHGRIFQSEELAGYFSAQPWYRGTIASEDFDADVHFSEMERWNYQLISQIEKRLGEESGEVLKTGFGYHLDAKDYSYDEVYQYLRSHPEKQLQIGGKEPVYGYILPDSLTRRLTEEDFADMSLQVANYAKNEIAARNGKIFNTRELDGYFSLQPWYVPQIPSDLFAYEEQLDGPALYNYDLLKAYAKKLGKLQNAKKEKGYGYLLDTADYTYEPVYEYIEKHAGGMKE